MRLVMTFVALAGLSGCLMRPETAGSDPRRSTQSSSAEHIDPYHRDKIPDTPYEVRKAELERDDHLAGRTGPTYPPLFGKQKQEDDE